MGRGTGRSIVLRSRGRLCLLLLLAHLGLLHLLHFLHLAAYLRCGPGYGEYQVENQFIQQVKYKQ